MVRMADSGMIFDPGTESGARALERLEREVVIWLTTVRADGQPQSSPVWFLWAGGEVVVLSQPAAGKVRNVGGQPLVALHLADDDGGDVVTIEARAAVGGELTEAEAAAYVDKYGARIEAIGYTPESMRAAYSTVLRLRPTHARTY
jgi:PPOX class probable F420-dependent enzyme